MKKILFIVIFLVMPTIVLAEAVDSFRALVSMNEDATVLVREQIIYDFGSDNRHGIFRDIPVVYKTTLGSYRADITDISVVNAQGRTWQFETFRNGNNLRIKIGDPDRYVTGFQTYILSYTVHDVISYFKTFDELYWNVTGNGWGVPIRNAGGIVSLPIHSKASFESASCFEGRLGADTPCDSAQVHGATSTIPETFAFLEDELLPGEGVTIAVSFPKNVVYEPTSVERFTKMVRENGIVVLPFFVLLIMLKVWQIKGRDPKGRGTIVPQYTPESGLTPAEIGTIVNEFAENKDITAEIIHLAVLGYLKIHQIEKRKIIFTDTDYLLQKLKEPADLPNRFQKLIMNAIFQSKHFSHEDVGGERIRGVLLSSLKNKVQKEYKEIQKLLYSSLTRKGYFVKGPRKVRTTYSVVGGIAIGAAWIVGAMFQHFLAAISVGVSGAIIVVFAFIMPKKTKQGVMAKEHIEGLKMYLRVAEKDRLAFHNAPEHTPEEFDRLLPFAMALGVEKEWAEQFKNIYTAEPRWYSTYSGGAFNTGAFASDLKAFSTATSSNMAPSSSGSGGGSSGGGFGGGGGGSW